MISKYVKNNNNKILLANEGQEVLRERIVSL